MKNVAFIFLLTVFTLSSCSKENVDNNTETASISINKNITVTPENKKLINDIVLEINNYRTELGLNTVTVNETIAKELALNHSDYMASKNKASHDFFGYRSQTIKSNGATAVGENVAFGYNDALSVVQGWANSPSHKAVLEGDYNTIGLGIITGKNNTNYITSLFYK